MYVHIINIKLQATIRTQNRKDLLEFWPLLFQLSGKHSVPLKPNTKRWVFSEI